MTINQEINQFRLQSQTLIGDGAELTNFSPNRLNMLESRKYCAFSVIVPTTAQNTVNAVVCDIKNLVVF